MILIAAGAGSDLDEGSSDAASPTPATEPTSSPTPSPTPAEVVVPEVVGKNVGAAMEALEADDLSVVVRARLTEAAREGTVLDQSVEAGSTLAAQSEVVLTVAESFPTIPHVVGDKLAAARRTLEDRGFDFRVKRETSNKPRDTVIRQSPSAGTSARPGRMVLLVIAKPAPREPAEPVSNDCQGYSPCIPPGPDVDCAGGEGDGPRYVSGPVRVTGSDPYGLDGNNDGVGCE